MTDWSPPSTPKGQISRVPHLPGLDGLRAVAVVSVMVYHANKSWLHGGFLGVEVFFVISGLPDHVAADRRARTQRARRPAPVLAAPVPPVAARRCSSMLGAAGGVPGRRVPRRAGSHSRRHRRRRRLRQQLVPDLGRRRVHRERGVRAACATCGRWRSRSSSTCCGRWSWWPSCRAVALTCRVSRCGCSASARSSLLVTAVLYVPGDIDSACTPDDDARLLEHRAVAASASTTRCTSARSVAPAG